MKIIKILFLWCACGTFMSAQETQPTIISGDTVVINMAALDQPYMYNRMGTSQPTGMIFALERDIVPTKRGAVKKEGHVKLRHDKRPRPIVLRANVGDIMVINFTNYLRPYNPNSPTVEFYPGYPTKQKTVNSIYPATRHAGVHIVGTELVKTIADDASFVGSNNSSLVGPGGKITYVLLAAAEGTFVLHSTGDNIADGTIRAGQISNGLFGSLVVEPPEAEWYRSQVTEEDLYDATSYWTKLDGTKTNKPKNPTPKELTAFKQKNKGFPFINYDAQRNNIPLLKMYKQIRPHARELLHTDLTALITGRNGGNFSKDNPSPSFYPVESSPDRRQPYREFSIHYHEAPYAVQAFPEFYENADPSDKFIDLPNTIQGGVDQFAFNYGTGGIGAEIFANRVKVGPMANCIDCAYEEFFLSAWAVGDPAQVVDFPANAVWANKEESIPVDSLLQKLMKMEASLTAGIPIDLLESFVDIDAATKVLFPDDPSNVYHSYMNDHVKFRIVHCGAGITHVHHQHAHQWLHSPNSDVGHYLDSQTINPGASYTLEIVHGGSGNLNKTVGDQIFHCHFYPHFAQGMWAMWRVHDVLETGTVMNSDGVVADNSRAYPDAEILKGTPIPGLVPIPTLAMAPVPAKVTIVNGQVSLVDEGISPGYPFYIPGVAGQRVPHPPMDFAKGDVTTKSGKKIPNTELNGGLPRNVVIDGVVQFENHTIYDWTKITDSLHSIKLPESGTYYEQLAMKTHEQREHSTLTPNGTPGFFILNGRPPVQGAPYADPAVDKHGKAAGTLRRYKAANIQVDAVLNELGWHYPQQRPIVLWGDVAATVAGQKPPEPFFMRANSEEYIEFWSTNLVPEYYELDDYQVRTPTDVIGQHIHLVKFDVTSSDGAANGWNYEDGTLSPDLVRSHIKSINNGVFYDPPLQNRYDGTILGSALPEFIVTEDLEPYLPMDIWGESPEDQNWIGAQTTIQRWYSDPLLDNPKIGKAQTDRTLRTVFTHDHFGPSTHQQIGLYAGLLIEPNGSKWLNSSTGTPLGFAQLGTTREVPVAFNFNSNGAPNKVTSTLSIDDGGPTDWQAIIQTNNVDSSYREFMLEFQDNQQAYLPGSIAKITPYPEYYNNTENGITFRDSVNNSYRGWIDSIHAIGAPSLPELVTTGNKGVLSVNYRNSPLPARVAPSAGGSPESTDMAYSFSSLVKRGIPALNSQPTPGYIDATANEFIWPVESLSPGMNPQDPYTPLLRAYQGDKIQVRTLVGAHVNPHFFNIHGVKWFFEPSFENSGYRATQMTSLSEHFEMNFQLPFSKGNANGNTDYLYLTNADDTGLQAGTWGLMRSSDRSQPMLQEMPNNKLKEGRVVTPEETGCGCPTNAPVRYFDVTAISIDQYQQNGPDWGILVYNETYRNFDSKAIIFVETAELEAFKFSKEYQPKPLVLRANAGDCIKVKVRNEITPEFVNNTGNITFGNLTVSDTTITKSVTKSGIKKDTTITSFNPGAFSYETSFTVGLHAELLNYDVSTSDGTSVGENSLHGQLLKQGAANNEVNYTWYAGQWNSDGRQFTSQSVELGACLLTAPDPLLQYVSGLYGALIVEPENSYWVVDKGNPTSASIYESEKAYMDKADPLFREFVMIFQDNISVASEPVGIDLIGVGETANGAINYKSEPLASRLFITASGPNNFNSTDISDVVSNSVVHAMPETPWFVAKAKTPVRFRLMYPGGLGDGSTFDLHGHVWQELPYTDKSTKLGYNPESQWLGARGQLGALNSFDILINSAGGTFGVPGDYLYRDYRNQTFQDGIWGLFTVTDGYDAIVVTEISGLRNMKIEGVVSVNPNTGGYASAVTLSSKGVSLGESKVNEFTGEWSLSTDRLGPKSDLTVTSIQANGSKGGSRTYTVEEVNNLKLSAKERIIMEPVKRSTLHLTEPGANRRDVILPRD